MPDATDRPTEPRPIARWAVGSIVLAVLAAVVLIGFSLSRPEPPGFMPTVAAEPFPGASDGSLRLTVDASDPEDWRFVALAEGRAVGANDAWDLAFRRFHIMANGGPGFAGTAAIADVGQVGGLQAAAVPPDTAFRTTDAASDSTHPAIDRWYRYGFASHLLTPLGRTYVVRTSGRYYALRVAGYYCPGARPGCLTIRYLPLDLPEP